VARHVRGHAVAAGHPCLASVVQETVRKILARDDVKPHKVHYYLERRDPAVETKMTEVLCVYREIAVLRAAEADAGNVAIISWRSATLDFSTFLVLRRRIAALLTGPAGEVASSSQNALTTGSSVHF
jgi:hypothetical protein